jgi:hypothetical protein
VTDDVSSKVDRALARFDRVTRALDERDGPVRAAARRERSRVNTDFKRRLSRVGIWLLLISMATVVVGIITPIGMFGFLAAVMIAVGAAIALAFTPTQPAARAPTPDLANGQMVQRFDSYLYRARSALPAPARAEIDSISSSLPALKQVLERIDTLDPSAQDARRLMSIHLPGLIDRYQQVPSAFRSERDSEDMTVDQRLVEGLNAAKTALHEITEKLARADVDAFETQGRFIKSRYSDEPIE